MLIFLEMLSLMLQTLSAGGQIIYPPQKGSHLGFVALKQQSPIALLTPPSLGRRQQSPPGFDLMYIRQKRLHGKKTR